LPAAVHYQRLKSFGFPDLGVDPRAPLISGTDGAFYGTTYLGGDNDAGVVFRVGKDGTGYSVLHSFPRNSIDGQNPQAGLVEGSDGALYGTTQYGGAYNAGVVFRVNKDGTGYGVLYRFGGGADGANPQSGLVEAGSGALYGTTPSGGDYGWGTVFRLNKDSTGYGVLHTFGGSATDGQQPRASLIRGSDGVLYGTTAFGGAYTNLFGEGAGTVFKLNPDGTGYTVLYNFGNGAADGAAPSAALVEGTDAALYGTTSSGGGYGFGTVFRSSRDGSNYTTLASFPPLGLGDGPSAWLVQGSNGALYGTRPFGGSSSNAVGSVFKLNTDGSGYSVLHDFIPGGTDGTQPAAALVEGSDGALYGTTQYGGADGSGTLFSLNKDGSIYNQLRSFRRVGPDSQGTYAGLVQGPDGAFYGTTYRGGTNGSGTVFKLNGDGSSYRIVQSFDGGQGASPYGGLLVGSDGILYGTASGGGPEGGGTVFKLSTDGTGYSLLHGFSYVGGEGNFPVTALIEGSDGALYGTTLGGGTNNAGTVFKLGKDGGSYGVLYSFLGTNGDGQGPNCVLLEATNGALYGTTWLGGSNNAGTVFRLERDGTGYAVLHRFRITPGDGLNPFAGLVQGSDGALYGTTESGGTNGGAGTVFKLNPDGSGYRVIHSFNGRNGRSPEASLTEGWDGALYGTTSGGGSNNLGTVFRLNKDGTAYTVLYDFPNNGADGQSPFSNLVLGTDGAFYGTTDAGGEFGWGTVFKVWPPETPDLISATNGPAGIYVSLAGVSGSLYQVLRSPDLINWSVLTNVFMPSGGIYTHIDKAPPFPSGYYLAAWLP
jgi:uncharacterized repeat protein (TIGR03803 family)